MQLETSLSMGFNQKRITFDWSRRFHQKSLILGRGSFFFGTSTIFTTMVNPHQALKREILSIIDILAHDVLDCPNYPPPQEKRKKFSEKETRCTLKVRQIAPFGWGLGFDFAFLGEEGTGIQFLPYVTETIATLVHVVLRVPSRARFPSGRVDK